MSTIHSLEFFDDKLRFLDQTKLPLSEDYIVTDSYNRIAEAIERLEIRGAPAIGIAAAYGLALSTQNTSDVAKSFTDAFNRLLITRPTAVNLFYALNEMKNIFDSNNKQENIYDILLNHALSIHKSDIQMCNAIAENGFEIFTKKSNILTHCNTGSLATGGNGTALNVIRYGYEKGMVNFVHVDETRPLLQGSRLTAWELNKYSIPFSINTDSTAAYLMKDRKVDIVIVGADRIAANGDTANKIGTYNLAVLCDYHKIPFYIAAPTTTIDKNCKNGEEIKIEQRAKTELLNISHIKISNNEYDVYNPAFDITPGKLITGIITEKLLYKPPYDFRNV